MAANNCNGSAHVSEAIASVGRQSAGISQNGTKGPLTRVRHASSPDSRGVTPIPLSRCKVYNNGDATAYEMYSKPRGHCLIINVEEFGETAHDHKTRVGSQYDAETIKTLFEELYFIVEHHHNLKYLEMKDVIRKFASKEAHKKTNACFVFIMSHGEVHDQEDSFVTSDGRLISISWIEQQFNNENAPYLHYKPKVLVFHCCRGGEFDYGIRSGHHLLEGRNSLERNEQGDDGRSDHDGREYAQKGVTGRLPTISDMLVLYSTVPGKVAIRDKEEGSWYIQLLCRAIRENAHCMKFRDICDKASQLLVTKMAKKGGKDTMQSSEYTVRTFKNLYLNPFMFKPEANTSSTIAQSFQDLGLHEP